MASRRLLKKEIYRRINELGYLYFCDKIGFIKTGKVLELSKEDSESVLDFIDKSWQIQEEFIKRISHTDPGKAKAYYKKLREDFKTTLENQLYTAFIDDETENL